MIEVRFEGSPGLTGIAESHVGMKDLLRELLKSAGYRKGVYVFRPIRGAVGASDKKGLKNVTVTQARQPNQVEVRAQPGTNGTCMRFLFVVPMGETEGDSLERLRRAVTNASNPERKPSSRSSKTGAPQAAVPIEPETLAQAKPENLLDKLLGERREMDEVLVRMGADLQSQLAEFTRLDIEKMAVDDGLPEVCTAVKLSSAQVETIEAQVVGVQVVIDDLFRQAEELLQRVTILEGEKNTLNAQLDNEQRELGLATEKKASLVDTLRTTTERMRLLEVRIRGQKDLIRRQGEASDRLNARIRAYHDAQRHSLASKAQEMPAEERRRLIEELQEGLEPATTTKG
jgi:hypothetical protein